MGVAGFTSTGSKHPDVLFDAFDQEVTHRMQRSAGSRLWDDQGKEYLDFIMALGAVALGYGHPDVNRAAIDAIERGGIGSLAPVEEELLAEELSRIVPAIEQVRFLKSGAEAVAAALRIARVITGRDEVLGCGYHGWLDWCSQSEGVPAATQALYRALPFNDPERSVAMIRERGDRLACVIIEPVIEAPPSPEWLQVLRAETSRIGALLVYDEIKTAFRVGLQGAAGCWGGAPDLLVLGKALANGYPLAAVGGRAEIMRRVSATWISSTMATEFVSLAAARATLRVMKREEVPEHLALVGGHLLAGLQRLADRFPRHIERAAGVPQMCYLRFTDEKLSGRVARECLQHGLLFKRSAYNFVSLAHDTVAVDRAIDILEEVLGRC